MPESVNGSCLCGQVRFAASGTFDHFFLCHCQRCRKGSGSAHGANLFASDASLRWLAGQALVQRFTLPGTRHCRSFCRHCGGALPTPIADDMLMMPAGCLDSHAPLAAQAHIMAASKADWDTSLAALPWLEGTPAP